MDSEVPEVWITWSKVIVPKLEPVIVAIHQKWVTLKIEGCRCRAVLTFESELVLSLAGKLVKHSQVVSITFQKDKQVVQMHF